MTAHSHGHSHGHHHAGPCGGLDHFSGDYTEGQRADLASVLGFNHQLAHAIDECQDISAVIEFLDPDPLNYMWVDEGQGQIGRVIGEATTMLAAAPPLIGHQRAELTPVPDSRQATRPCVAARGNHTVVAWVEWLPDSGDVLQASVDGGPAAAVSGAVTDVFRPCAVIDATGTPWLFFAAARDGAVGVYAVRHRAGSWTDPEPVSDTTAPSFNQEAVATADGGVEVCWQASAGQHFAIHTRRFDPETGWRPTEIASLGTENNVWDPAIATRPDGGSCLAWSEYAEGGYRIVVRERRPDTGWAEPRTLTRGADYALHPSLAVTPDDRLWCAFDVLTVAGHGGSGPTRLRPASELGTDPTHAEGMRDPGASIPPELLPEVTATIRVVAVDPDGLREPDGHLAPGLDVVPSGLPRLAVTETGALLVAYRVHRKLPLMTYYWEVATQWLGTEGWLSPTTYRGSDATLEEPSVAVAGETVVLAAQTDGRLATALRWTEGFGGRECPYLAEHQGAVIWHSVHGAGVVGTAVLVPPPLAGSAPGTLTAVVEVDQRHEVRRWLADPPDRYRTSVRGTEYALYWGDLHRHSLVSRCTAGDEPSLEDFYRYSWDVCEYDFWAVTDHSENSSAFQWWSIQKIADLFCVDERFVPLYGFEWTSADCGHQNVIFGDVGRGAPTYSAFAEGTTDPDGLWAALDRHPEHPCITIPHHPGSAMVHNDWDYFHPVYSRQVEVFQACRGNYEFDGCFRQYSDGTREGTFTLDGLLRGHRFGLLASSDHGHGASYVGAFATSLDRGSIFAALQARRTFAATTRGIVVDVRYGEDAAFIGEETTAVGEPRLDIHVEAYTDLARVDIVRNGATAWVHQPAEPLPTGWLRLPVRLEWGGADHSTDWGGTLDLSQGRVVATDFWSPEVVAASATSVRWVHTTHSFGEPYGAQRGGIELTLELPEQATVEVRLRDHLATFTAADLAGATAWILEPDPHDGFARIQPGVGGLRSLRTRCADLTWTDRQTADGSMFYYVRVYLVDGEMAWSSPIWVDRPGS